MSNAFMGCTSLTTFNAPIATGTLGGSFFKGCTSLVNVTIPGIEGLRNEVFRDCTQLETINIPLCNGIIEGSTFRNCASLKNLNIGSITGIKSYGFAYCSNLTSLDLSQCTFLDGAALNGCTNLVSLGNTSNILSITGGSAFAGCSSLTGTLDLHNADLSIMLTPDALFSGCSNLTKIKLGHVTQIGRSWQQYSNDRKPFANCSSLVTIDIQQLDYANKDSWAFGNNPELRNFIIRNTESIPQLSDETDSLNINGFGGSNVKVYVTDALVNTYKTAEGWENIIDYIYPLSEYVE